MRDYYRDWLRQLQQLIDAAVAARNPQPHVEADPQPQPDVEGSEPSVMRETLDPNERDD